jgi:PAS domain S-box-containing protein
MTPLADFFEMSLDHLCVVGFDGYFIRVNPSWTRTLGWTLEELMARPSEDLLHPDDRRATLEGRKRLHDGGALGPLVNRYRCKDGSYRWFEWRSVARTDRGVVYAAARDVTDQKRAEERLAAATELQEKMQRQLIFADRMASVGTLAAGAAHEINNPLAIVISNIGMLVEQLADAGTPPSMRQLEELREIALEAQEGAERIRKVIRGLKTFSRVEEERPAVIEVRPVIELAVSMTINEIRPRARLVLEHGAMPRIDADEARLGQVFINLLVNAAQALPDDQPETNEIRIATSTDGDGRAVIEVHDTGPGIPPEIADRIFDPFFTTKPIGIGTGLGLFICHNIVTAMGGEIAVRAVAPHGTCVRIMLPAANAADVADVA